jgi:hypothetical protein
MNADQIDSKVDWTPIAKSGAILATCKLKKISDVRLDFIPTSGFIIMSLFFLISGLFVLIRVAFYMHLDEDGFYVALILGSLFMLTGVYLLFVNRNRVIFKNINGSWRISKSNVFLKTIKFLPYKPMYAIQVLEKQNDESSYYELNIIYEDGSRENILSQAEGDLVINNATVLGDSLKIPFLNGVKVGKPFSKWGEFRPFS